MTDTINVVELAAELTAAWLANPNTRTTAEDVPAFLMSMHAAVTKLSTGTSMETEATDGQTYEPAVTVRKSLSSPDHIVSMIDGKKYKTLRRHLSTHGMTPEQYRERFNLKADYPMVAATYSEARRDGQVDRPGPQGRLEGRGCGWRRRQDGPQDRQDRDRGRQEDARQRGLRPDGEGMPLPVS